MHLTKGLTQLLQQYVQQLGFPELMAESRLKIWVFVYVLCNLLGVPPTACVI